MNIKTLLDFSKSEFMDTWTRITDEIKELTNKKNPSCANNRVCFKFYFSGHGCTFKGSTMLTNMVMKEDDNGWYIPIEEMLRKLSLGRNVSISAILDCCRNTIEAKSQQDKTIPD